LNFLTPLSIIIILAFYVLLRKHPKHKFILPTILSSLGILGTFTGIAIGLYFFDVNNIDTSVPKLLEGLRLAFISSITGIVLTILIKFELSNDEEFEEIHKEIETETFSNDEEYIIPILKEILEKNNYSSKFDELNLKLSGKDNQSMGIILEDILEGINHLKNQSQNNDGKINNTLENKIQELLESNKSHNENLLSFINRISNSIGIETGVDNNDNQDKVLLLLKEIINKGDYTDKIEELNSKLSGKDNESLAMIMSNIADGIKKVGFQSEQFNEDQNKILNKKFQEFISSIKSTNNELINMIDKLAISVGDSTKEVLPEIEQNMSQFSENLGKTMLEATEKMSQSFEKKSVEADESGKWQVRSVIELQELNTNIKKLLKESDDQTQQLSDNNKRLIFTLKTLLEKESEDEKITIV